MIETARLRTALYSPPGICLRRGMIACAFSAALAGSSAGKAYGATSA
jgi:hypothetical protein